MTDSDLLRQFVHGNESAFAELVRRRVDLVYAAALRHVSGDHHRAEDIAQQVFVALARKAPTLTGHTCLVAWLYASTRFAAINTLKGEQRRSAREKQADDLHAMSSSTKSHWEQIRPVIDEAMQELDERDRESVLLRFFSQQSFAEIGEQLGLTENAAQKRVDRALDRLAAAFSRRGISSTTAALSVAAADAVVAAPVALGESVMSVALASAGASSSIFAPALKILAAASVAGVLGWVGGSWHEQTVAKRESIHVAAEVAAKVNDLEARLAEASRRAVAAEADVAELLAAVPARRPAQTTRASVPVLRMPSTEAGVAKYVVLRGNTLLQITRDTGVTPEALRAANPVYDFTLMMVGDEINIPAPGVVPPPADRTSAEASPPKPAIPADAAYTVMAGDTLVKIAVKAGLTTDQIKSLNPDTNWLRLRIGDQLRVR